MSELTREEIKMLHNKERSQYWLKFGPYLSERQWATVREDYSSNGDAWSDFPFEHSKSRTYRWGEDGLAGVSDTRQLLNLSMVLWNGQDEILKEKAFGLTNGQGNHGEDVKDLYYYLDNTPSHSYMKYLYKYPQTAFPYKQLIEENNKRSRNEREFELIDTDALKDNKYFDVVFELAKGDDDPEDLNLRITAYNRGSEPAPLHILPHLVCRNTWSWGTEESRKGKPEMKAINDHTIEVNHKKFGKRYLVFAPSPGFKDDSPDVFPELIFTDNETNNNLLYNSENTSKYVKDAFHEYVIHDKKECINPKKTGTKTAAWFSFTENGGVPPGDYVTIRYKFNQCADYFDEFEFDQVFARRQDEADAFYWRISPLPITDHLRQVQRQAFAGLLWNKQFYHFVHDYWAQGDPNTIKPPTNRAGGRNKDWKHLYIEDILSMPDKWEYPFFATWDLAFHTIPFAMIDPEFAKKQLDLLTREWYMHPNGQMPAYEWNFSDVNPPVHAWAAYRVFKIERKMYGHEDLVFLETVFQKLLLNFTWWVNRKDKNGNNVFQGGFLGLDNIGVFNRSEELPTGGSLEQADSTGWMGFFCLQMLNIALELAKTRPAYENIASKFFEHFILISDAMTYEKEGQLENSLWDDNLKFYFDAINYGDHNELLPVRSLVGLIPLYASLTLEPEILDKFPSFKKRLDWFTEHRASLAERNIASMEARGVGERLLLSLVNKERLVAILQRMMDEEEFLSPYGVRSLSKYHKDHPFKMDVNGVEYKVEYLPGESDSGMFGGNSNWRGPIWFPVNFLLVEALQRFHLYYGPDLKIECPKGSGDYLNLAQCAQEIEHRMIHLFLPDKNGIRASNGDNEILNEDPLFKDYVPFYEYFDGDTGRGLGASHQCGWTAVVAKWIHDNGTSCRLPRTPRSETSRSSIYLHGSNNKAVDDGVEDFLPRSGPFPGRLLRRKSGKSLLNITMNSLDLDDKEEAEALKSFKNSHNDVNVTQEINNNGGLSPTTSGASADSMEGAESTLLDQIKNTLTKFKTEKTDDEELSGDEFVAREK